MVEWRTGVFVYEYKKLKSRRARHIFHIYLHPLPVTIGDQLFGGIFCFLGGGTWTTRTRGESRPWQLYWIQVVCLSIFKADYFIFELLKCGFWTCPLSFWMIPFSITATEKSTMICVLLMWVIKVGFLSEKRFHIAIYRDLFTKISCDAKR